MFKKLRNITFTDRIDYILIFLLMSLSGNHAFGIPALMVIFVFSLGVFFYRKKSFDMIFISLILVVTFILLFQALIFDFIPLVTLMGFYARVFMVYFVIKSIGTTFIDKFVRVMIFLALMSLVFFVLMNLIPSFPNYIKPFSLSYVEEVEESTGYFSASYSTLFHTFRYMPYNPIPFVRNPGIFWEAGAFGGYLVVTLILNIMKTGVFFNKQNFIFIITIFTTASTSAFIALMALMFFYVLVSSKLKILKTIILPIISILAFFAFTYFDFLGAKIEKKIKLAQNPGIIYTTTSSRFVDAVRDMKAFEGHEIFGRGINQETRYTEIDKASGYTIRTNGFTSHLVNFGSIFFIFTFVLMYYSFSSIINYYNNINKLFSVYAILIIVLILQSQVYFRFPYFWGLLILSSIYSTKKGIDI